MTMPKHRAVLPAKGHDPVSVLPAELAAHCLSFLAIRSLLGAQRVCQAWRRAITGGLPQIWRDVYFDDKGLADAVLGRVGQFSHGRTHSLRVDYFTSHCVHHLRAFSGLRVLDIRPDDLLTMVDINPVLPSLLLLEELRVNRVACVSFPPLQFLKSVWCATCGIVSGLGNLPALTKFEMSTGQLASADELPTSLRELYLHSYTTNDPLILDRIAAMADLERLSTDWSFAEEEDDFARPYDQLSFLPRLHTLQRLDVSCGDSRLITKAVFKYLGAMASLRELKLSRIDATDQDLACLPQLTNLQEIMLSNAKAITSQGLQHLCKIPNLTRLTIGFCYKIADFSPVSTCGQLKVLELLLFMGGHPFTAKEMESISQLQHLETLALVGEVRESSTLALLCALKRLRKLKLLVGCRDFAFPVSVFDSLPTLTSLEHFNAPNVDDVDEFVDILVQMPHLRHLCLSRSTRRQNARLGAALPRLDVLD